MRISVSEPVNRTDKPSLLARNHEITGTVAKVDTEDDSYCHAIRSGHTPRWETRSFSAFGIPGHEGRVEIRQRHGDCRRPWRIVCRAELVDGFVLKGHSARISARVS